MMKAHSLVEVAGRGAARAQDMGMPDPAPIINSLGGIATRQQLIARGCSGFDLTIAVQRAEIRRVRQARYSTPKASPDAVVATRVGGLLAGPSAARSYGLWAGFDRRVHISVGANSSRLRTNFAPSFQPKVLTPDFSEREVVVHWLVDGAVPELGPECWRVPLVDCLRQVVRWCDEETAVACLDTALTKFCGSRQTILNAFQGAPLVERLVAGACECGSDSGTESIVRQRLLAVGIHVIQQVQFAVGRVDMRVKGTRILLEVDSREFHDGAEARERDRFRDAELVAMNYVVIRLSYQRIVEDWDWCLRIIRAAISHA